MFLRTRPIALALAAVLTTWGGYAAGQEVDEDEAFLSGGAGAEKGAGNSTEDAAEEDAVLEEGPAGDVPTEDEALEPRKKDHRHQGFVNVLFGVGWYMVAPYDKNDPDKACSDLKPPENPDEEPEGDPLCSGRSAMHMDFLGGFGITDGVEVFAMFRLGLDQPNDHQPEQLRMLGAGVKAYSPSDGLFKIAFGVAPLFDFSKKDSGAKDMVIHVPIAAHFDFVPWFGAYLQVAPNISFISEFKLDITGGIGVQGRFP